MRGCGALYQGRRITTRTQMYIFFSQCSGPMHSGRLADASSPCCTAARHRHGGSDSSGFAGEPTWGTHWHGRATFAASSPRPLPRKSASLMPGLASGHPTCEPQSKKPGYHHQPGKSFIPSLCACPWAVASQLNLHHPFAIRNHATGPSQPLQGERDSRKLGPVNRLICEGSVEV